MADLYLGTDPEAGAVRLARFRSCQLPLRVSLDIPACSRLAILIPLLRFSFPALITIDTFGRRSLLLATFPNSEVTHLRPLSGAS